MRHLCLLKCVVSAHRPYPELAYTMMQQQLLHLCLHISCKLLQVGCHAGGLPSLCQSVPSEAKGSDSGTAAATNIRAIADPTAGVPKVMLTTCLDTAEHVLRMQADLCKGKCSHQCFLHKHCTGLTNQHTCRDRLAELHTPEPVVQTEMCKPLCWQL